VKALSLKSVFFFRVWQESKKMRFGKKEQPKSKKIRPHPKRGGAEIFKEFFSLV
jgi:hypothetical protein